MGFFKKNPPPEQPQAPPPPPRRSYDTVQEALTVLRDELSVLKTILQPETFTLNCFDYMPPTTVMGGAMSLLHKYDGIGSLYLSLDPEQSPHAAIFRAHNLRPKMHIKRVGANMVAMREDLPGGKNLTVAPQDFSQVVREIGVFMAHTHPQAAALLYVLMPDYAPEDDQIVAERGRILNLDRPPPPPPHRHFTTPSNIQSEFERLRRDIEAARIGDRHPGENGKPRNPVRPRSVFY